MAIGQCVQPGQESFRHLEILVDYGRRLTESMEAVWKCKQTDAQKTDNVCLCWCFTTQSTQWGHVERGQFT